MQPLEIGNQTWSNMRLISLDLSSNYLTKGAGNAAKAITSIMEHEKWIIPMSLISIRTLQKREPSLATSIIYLGTMASVRFIFDLYVQDRSLGG